MNLILSWALVIDHFFFSLELFMFKENWDTTEKQQTSYSTSLALEHPWPIFWLSILSATLQLQ